MKIFQSVAMAVLLFASFAAVSHACSKTTTTPAPTVLHSNVHFSGGSHTHAKTRSASADDISERIMRAVEETLDKDRVVQLFKQIGISKRVIAQIQADPKTRLTKPKDFAALIKMGRDLGATEADIKKKAAIAKILGIEHN